MWFFCKLTLITHTTSTKQYHYLVILNDKHWMKQGDNARLQPIVKSPFLNVRKPQPHKNLDVLLYG